MSPGRWTGHCLEQKTLAGRRGIWKKTPNPRWNGLFEPIFLEALSHPYSSMKHEEDAIVPRYIARSCVLYIVLQSKSLLIDHDLNAMLGTW